MKKLLPFFKPYTKECILAPLFKLLEALFDLFVPLVVAMIIDKAIPLGKEGTGTLLTACGILVSLAIVGLICAVIAQFFAAKAAVGLCAKVKKSLFSHITSLSYSEIDTLGTASLITRMTSDINQLQSGINLVLRLLLRSPIIVFGAMIMAFTINIKAALIFAVAIPILSVVVFGIMLYTIPLYKNVQQNLDGVTKATRENLTGIRVIRAFCNQDSEIENYKAKTKQLTILQKFVGKISALMNPFTYIIINLAVIFLVRLGAVQVNIGLLTTGQVVALYNYMSQILIELVKMANVIINATKAVACANRIADVFNIKNTVISGKSQVNGGLSVEFCNVSFKYKENSGNSLENISFKINPGQTVGVIGGTGSGKTTLVNLIPRFYDATEGTVKIGSRDIKELDTVALREKIAVVPQKAVLFKGTLRENIQWGKKADDDEILKALHLAQADNILAELKDGLDSAVAQGGKNFSGGQRQRLTIARALVKKSDIIILDDSSSALDFATDAALRSALKNLDFDPTVFIISQRTSSIKHADVILVLNDGILVGKGTHEELLENNEIYKEIHISQFKKEEQ